MNINELEQLAKEATPGPWKFGVEKYDDDTFQPYVAEKQLNFSGPGFYENPAIFSKDDTKIVGCDEYYVFSGEHDIAYIIAANPSAIRELISAYRESVAALVHIQRCIPINGFAQIHYESPTWEQIDTSLDTANRLGVE